MEDQRTTSQYRHLGVPAQGFLMPVTLPMFPFLRFTDISAGQGYPTPQPGAYPLPPPPQPPGSASPALPAPNAASPRRVGTARLAPSLVASSCASSRASSKCSSRASSATRASSSGEDNGTGGEDSAHRRTPLGNRSEGGTPPRPPHVQSPLQPQSAPASGESESRSSSPASVELLYEFAQDLHIGQPYDEELERVLSHSGIELSANDRKMRDRAVEELENLAEQWISSVAERQGISWVKKGRLLSVFGSYRLNVSTIKSDLDCVLTIPAFVSREEFFSVFRIFLERHPSVKFINVVPNAFVPVIKMQWRDRFEVDVLVCRLRRDDAELPSVRPLEVRNEQLAELDERCIRSLNGLRVTEALRVLVRRHECSLEVFQVALRAVRLWARRRGIYSNVLGYLGGVSWAILVCAACLAGPPPASVAELLRRFFAEFAQRDWENQPVVLCPVEPCPKLHYATWEPTVTNGNRFMPIITPVYPAQNSAYNVTRSGKTIILEELRKGKQIVDAIFRKEKNWSDLFVENDFIHHYNHFFVVSVGSNNGSVFYRAASLTESRLREIVLPLESLRSIRIVQVGIDAFRRQHASEPLFNRKWLLGIRVTPGLLQRNEFGERDLDLRQQRREFLGVLKLHAERADLDWQSVRCEIGYFKKPELLSLLAEMVPADC